MEIRFTQSARKHRIGRSRALYVIENSLPEFVSGDLFRRDKIIWVSEDDRGLELEIVAVAENDYLVVIHVMPTIFRKEHKRWNQK
jgi:hypothetical protein